MNRGSGIGNRPDARYAIHDTRGSVLIFSVWAIGLLTIFTVVIGRIAAGELMFGSWVKNRVLLQGLAKAGIERAQLEIESDKFIAFDALNESWASNNDALADRPLGVGQFSVECREGEAASQPDAPPRYGACDESARLNINTASEANLVSLLKAVNPTLSDDKMTEIAEAILDWRDKDDAVMTHGAEASYYKVQPNPYELRNDNFVAVEELLMVKGIDRAIFEKIKPYVTVYTAGAVNFNTAGLVVLQALGLSPELAAKVIEYRAGPDRKEGTEDDKFFQDTGGITPSLSAAMSFSSEEYAQISNAASQGIVAVKSDAFRIHSIGRLIKDGKKKENGVIESSVTCVVNRKGEILFWQEGE